MTESSQQTEHPLETKRAAASIGILGLWVAGASWIDSHPLFGIILCSICLWMTFWLCSRQLCQIWKASPKQWPWFVLGALAIEISVPTYVLTENAYGSRSTEAGSPVATPVLAPTQKIRAETCVFSFQRLPDSAETSNGITAALETIYYRRLDEHMVPAYMEGCNLVLNLRYVVDKDGSQEFLKRLDLFRDHLKSSHDDLHGLLQSYQHYPEVINLTDWSGYIKLYERTTALRDFLVETHRKMTSRELINLKQTLDWSQSISEFATWLRQTREKIIAARSEYSSSRPK